jgi:hypothetical protein
MVHDEGSAMPLFPPSLSRCLAITGVTLALATLRLWSADSKSPAIDVAKLPPAAARPIDFVKDVQPIFQAACASCHGEKKQKGDLRLDRKDSVTRSGSVIAGKSAASDLIHRVAGLNDDIVMPPSGKRLTPEQVGILRAWIDQGAKWPDAGAKSASGHWAYQPLVRPRVPAVKNAGWVRTPIDAFILAKLEAKNLSPAAEADRRTLLRRVSFDLIGLPPTPEEIEAFVNDRSPDAYERVVNRLLASPHYGERWARHWMDVIHFAETHGHDQDVPREHAWRYRDYLIDAFNQDRPYARFVQEQLAGDVLFPDDPRGIVATGFIAAGPWDESSQQSIRDDTLDKKVAQTLDRDDMLTTVMGTLTSTTIHCARCHDHKFDPIAQQDYYNLSSIFAGVDRANRTFDPDPSVGRERKALLKRKQELEAGREALASMLLSPAVQAEVPAWEKAHGDRREPWVPLELTSVVSAGKQTFKKLPDKSILFGGLRPEVDTYTLEAVTDLKGITGVRLEVLTDASLFHHGPGRQDNGNLHLTEFRVQAAERTKPDTKKPVKLQNPSADFNQAGWSIERAIDGDPKSAWGIYPEVGKPHAAVFEFAQPVNIEGGTLLTFTLEQNHGGGHLIGRPRLSITTAPRPLKGNVVAPALANLLAVPAAQRSDAQRAELALFMLREQVEHKLGALPKPEMVYAAAPEFTPVGSFRPAKGCRPVFLLRRGDVRSPLDKAEPAALTCIPGLEPRFKIADASNEGARRAALAGWIVDAKNVLTWRSIVNRVWHYHFGHGIVRTPNDLGKMGATPTHPELFDWLAVTFRDDDQGSMKRLHKRIVMSAVYMQSSRHHAEHAKVDAANEYLWRMHRSRLDAESVRDAVLQITGKLDPKMGGPSVKQFIQKPGIHVTPDVNYQDFDVDNPALYRRSVYRFLFRTLPDPFMDTLDCPDASQFTPARSESVTALQALAMLNDKFMVRQCEHLAERLRQAHSTLPDQVRAAYVVALGRPPSDSELKTLTDYAAKHGLANACRVVFNCNEFMFVN